MAAAQGPATRERKDMSYYFIVTVSLSSDADTPYDSYIREVKPIVEKHGGEYLVRTNEVVPLSSGWKPDRVIVIRFPSREAWNAAFLRKNTGRSSHCVKIPLTATPSS